MAEDLMNYEHMTQVALRGVVRDAIRRVIREDGLPGAHHFYITFLTRFPGVEIDEGLAKKYPEEITIVLEHQFWDLSANEESFEVTLKFGGVPKYLHIPYTAISRFHDPSIGFALQFEPPKEMVTDSTDIARLEPHTKESKATNETLPTDKKDKTPLLKKKGKRSSKKDEDNTSDTDTDQKSAKGSEAKSEDGDSKVVSLDSFRKK